MPEDLLNRPQIDPLRQGKACSGVAAVMESNMQKPGTLQHGLKPVREPVAVDRRARGRRPAHDAGDRRSRNSARDQRSVARDAVEMPPDAAVAVQVSREVYELLTASFQGVSNERMGQMLLARLAA